VLLFVITGTYSYRDEVSSAVEGILHINVPEHRYQKVSLNGVLAATSQELINQLVN